MGGANRRAKGVAMIVVAAFICVAISALSSYIRYINEFDEKNLCAANRPYDLNVTIIDRTDPWREADVEKLKQYLKLAHSSVKMNDRLKIKVIHADNSNSTVVDTMFDLCNPGTESDANPLYQNPRKMQLRYQEEFDKPFNALTGALTKSGVAPKSPLLDVIASTINNSKVQKLNLVIVSDLFENGAEYNFYKHVPKDDDWVQVKEIINKNVNVEVKYIERKAYASQFRARVRDLWDAYFKYWGVPYHDNNFMTIY